MTDFASTIWTLVHHAQDAERRALDELIGLYRPPVARYLRRRGASAEEAEDLAQEVFIRIFEKNLLRKVEPSKGKFRSFVLGVANNVLREHLARQGAQKRGGSAVHVPLPEVAEDEKDFTHEWMLHMLRLAMKSLAQSASEPVRRDLELFRAFVRERPTYEALAAKFGVTTTRVRNAIYETKQRIRREVERCIHTYTCAAEEFRHEMAAFEEQAGA
jgi:RNA polymerase sigma-70 factor (ECF subfamily)